MKHFTIYLIRVYQGAISPILGSILGTPNICRFNETCSEYMRREILEKGVIKGTYLGILRIFKCQPFYSPSQNPNRRTG